MQFRFPFLRAGICLKDGPSDRKLSIFVFSKRVWKTLFRACSFRFDQFKRQVPA